MQGLPKKYKLSKKDFLQALTFAGEHLNVAIKNTKLSIQFSDDSTIAYYHAMYLNDPTATDVITFPMNEIDPKTKELILGDLLISYETAEREAQKRKIPIQKELILYAIHGFLHLNGYDDKNSRERKKMHLKQNQILKLVYP